LKEIALLLLDRVMDPRVKPVTVTGIRLSRDLKLAKVFYSVIGETEAVEGAQAGLDSARGFIKKQLGLRMKLRYVPDIQFTFDRSLASGARMDRLLESLHSEGEPHDGTGGISG
jgi:ribosome-binding factor A